MPPDDLIRRLYRVLVHCDEDRDTFNDTFLWMCKHPCSPEEYEHRFVTRFYFFRKDRWALNAKYVALGSISAPVAVFDSYDMEENNDTIEEHREQFINTLKDAIHKETHTNRQPAKKRKGRS